MAEQQKEKALLPKSTKSGWAIHEIANALGIFFAQDFQIDAEDVQAGQRILRQFLTNMNQPNPNIDGQGELTDEEMRGFLEGALSQEWTEMNVRNLYKEFVSLRARVSN